MPHTVRLVARTKVGGKRFGYLAITAASAPPWTTPAAIGEMIERINGRLAARAPGIVCVRMKPQYLRCMASEQ
jgi:hypothetical protein